MTAAKKKPRFQKNWLERVVFGVSLALVAGVLGYLAYEGSRVGDAPPHIEVRTGAPEQRGQHFIVPVHVTNHGDQTAEGVQVEVTLEGGAQSGGGSESGQFTVAFLPRRATHEGWVTFSTDPRAGRLKPRVLGYEKP